MPGVNRHGQAHIVSTAMRSPGPARGPAEVGGKPWFRPWFSIDPQPASISPTVSISIVFICAFLVDCGRILRHPAIKNDSTADRMAAHRKLDRRRNDLCAGALRKGALRRRWFISGKRIHRPDDRAHET